MDGFDVLVPVKPLASAKLRLRSVLDDAGRADLACALLAHVLRTLAAADGVARVVVVTDDPRAAAIAVEHGAAIAPDAAPGLNAALEAIIAARAAAGAQALAVLPGDLPWLTAEAVERLLGAAGVGQAAIASDHHGRGTSALAWRAPFAPERLAFGPDSLARHIQLFGARGGRVEVIRRDPAFRDLDDPADLAVLRADQAFDVLEGAPA